MKFSKAKNNNYMNLQKYCYFIRLFLKNETMRMFHLMVLIKDSFVEIILDTVLFLDKEC